MAILHFKIVMPMRWLAGNTHFLGQCGIDWSPRSMGKAIDALEAAMMVIEEDGSKYLDEHFMNNIFSRIHSDSHGNEIPLQPLVDAMTYQYEHKQTEAIDGSKVLPFDQLNAELFYPQRQENIETTETVNLMAIEVAETILKELRDPRKASSDYLSSKEGQFSWGQTTDDEHGAMLGKIATNDPAESPFASLTQQLQSFGRLLGIHASAVGHARINGDFNRDVDNESNSGAYHRLSPEMRESLMKFALKVAPAVRKSEKTSLNIQREAKQQKQDQLRKKKILAAQLEYAKALTYVDMFYSDACWRTKTHAQRAFNNLSSTAARLNAVKEQIRIRVIGFGWNNLHHPWSKNGVHYSPADLLKHLINNIIPQQNKRGVPDSPTLELPSRRHTCQLGTMTADVDNLDTRYEVEKESIIAEAVKMRDELEAQGETDRYEKLQPPRPHIDESLVGTEIEQLWTMTEEDGKKFLQWCQGLVIAVKTNNRVHIQWNESCLREGDRTITEEKLLKSKYNKHVEQGWRISINT